jgi:hypothetical protein
VGRLQKSHEREDQVDRRLVINPSEATHRRRTRHSSGPSVEDSGRSSHSGGVINTGNTKDDEGNVCESRVPFEAVVRRDVEFLHRNDCP